MGWGLLAHGAALLGAAARIFCTRLSKSSQIQAIPFSLTRKYRLADLHSSLPLIHRGRPAYSYEQSKAEKSPCLVLKSF